MMTAKGGKIAKTQPKLIGRITIIKIMLFVVSLP